MQAKALVRGEEVEWRGRAHVSHQRTARDLLRRPGDLAVGNAQEDHGRALTRRAAAKGAEYLSVRLAEGHGERIPHAAAADDGDWSRQRFGVWHPTKIGASTALRKTTRGTEYGTRYLAPATTYPLPFRRKPCLGASLLHH